MTKGLDLLGALLGPDDDDDDGASWSYRPGASAAVAGQTPPPNSQYVPWQDETEQLREKGPPPEAPKWRRAQLATDVGRAAEAAGLPSGRAAQVGRGEGEYEVVADGAKPDRPFRNPLNSEIERREGDDGVNGSPLGHMARIREVEDDWLAGEYNRRLGQDPAGEGVNLSPAGARAYHQMLLKESPAHAANFPGGEARLNILANVKAREAGRIGARHDVHPFLRQGLRWREKNEGLATLEALTLLPIPGSAAVRGLVGGLAGGVRGALQPIANLAARYSGEALIGTGRAVGGAAASAFERVGQNALGKLRSIGGQWNEIRAAGKVAERADDAVREYQAAHMVSESGAPSLHIDPSGVVQHAPDSMSLLAQGRPVEWVVERNLVFRSPRRSPRSGLGFDDAVEDLRNVGYSDRRAAATEAHRTAELLGLQREASAAREAYSAAGPSRVGLLEGVGDAAMSGARRGWERGVATADRLTEGLPSAREGFHRTYEAVGRHFPGENVADWVLDADRVGLRPRALLPARSAVGEVIDRRGVKLGVPRAAGVFAVQRGAVMAGIHAPALGAAAKDAASVAYDKVREWGNKIYDFTNPTDFSEPAARPAATPAATPAARREPEPAATTPVRREPEPAPAARQTKLKDTGRVAPKPPPVKAPQPPPPDPEHQGVPGADEGRNYTPAASFTRKRAGFPSPDFRKSAADCAHCEGEGCGHCMIPNFWDDDEDDDMDKGPPPSLLDHDYRQDFIRDARQKSSQERRTVLEEGMRDAAVRRFNQGMTIDRAAASQRPADEAPSPRRGIETPPPVAAHKGPPPTASDALFKQPVDDPHEGWAWRDRSPSHLPMSESDTAAMLDRGTFSILSAGKGPADATGAAWNDPVFRQRHEGLRNALKQHGFRYTEVRGNYGAHEVSFIVHHEHDPSLPPANAVLVHHPLGAATPPSEFALIRQLGARHQQESVIHSRPVEGQEGSVGRHNEMHFVTGSDAGLHRGGQGVNPLSEDAENFYTVVRHPYGDIARHTKFSLNFDFEKPLRPMTDTKFAGMRLGTHGVLIKSDCRIPVTVVGHGRDLWVAVDDPGRWPGTEVARLGMPVVAVDPSRFVATAAADDRVEKALRTRLGPILAATGDGPLPKMAHEVATEILG